MTRSLPLVSPCGLASRPVSPAASPAAGGIEPVFANLRSNKRLDRFTYRGQAKVSVQWLLYCLVHNLEKLAHLSSKYGPQSPRRGRSCLLGRLLRELGWVRGLFTGLRDLFEAPTISYPNLRLTLCH